MKKLLVMSFLMLSTVNIYAGLEAVSCKARVNNELMIALDSDRLIMMFEDDDVLSTDGFYIEDQVSYPNYYNYIASGDIITYGDENDSSENIVLTIKNAKKVIYNRAVDCGELGGTVCGGRKTIYNASLSYIYDAKRVNSKIKLTCKNYYRF